MHLRVGSKLGRYEILAPAGAGGMGEVYRARDTRLDRDVAIKVLPEDVADDPVWLARFEREARSVSGLNHPRICTLYDVGHEDSVGGEGEDGSEAGGRKSAVHFLVMEFLEGETLSARLAAGRIPLPEALHFGSQVAGALAAAHYAGVIHRDLKPGNVMLTKSGAKLLDFGLAKPLDAADSPQLTAAPTMTSPLTAQGMVVGTYQYMAPEVLAGGEADARSDIFALGALLYEMVAGQSAFGGQTQATVVASILKEEVRPLSVILPEAPLALSRLVERCLTKDPEKRWQSAADLAMELDWIASGGGAQAEPSKAMISAAEEDSRGGSARLAWALAGVFAVAAIFLGFGFLRSPDSDLGTRGQIRFEVPAPEGSYLRTMYESAAPPAVSPDGRSIVFGVTGSQGGDRLWIRPLDGPARSLPGTEGGMRPFWSPDSKSIGFFTTSEMRRIDIAGGPPLTIATVRSPRGGAWGADDTIVYAPSASGPLYRVAVGGGEPEPVTELNAAPREASHRYPHFLPDRRRFLYLALDEQGAVGTGDESQHRLMVGSLDDDLARQLMRGASNAVYAAGHLIFRLGTALQARPFDLERLEFTGDPFTLAESVHYDSGYERAIFSASDDVLTFVAGEFTGNTRLQLLDRSGTVLETLSDTGIQYETRFAPDSRRLATRSTTATGEVIWIVDLEQGTRVRLTFDDGVPRSPVWSPDGRRVAYGWSTDAGRSTRVSPVDGGGPPEVLVDESWNAHATDWSPDGRYLLLEKGRDEGGAEIWFLDLEKGGDPQPLIEAGHFISLPAISPDGRWLAYTSNESGRLEVYVTRFPSARGKWLVSDGGGLDPVWDIDSGSLLYLSLDHRMMQAPVSAAGENFQVGSPQPLFELLSYIDFAESVYDLSSDGKIFVANTISKEHMAAPLTVVVGWAEALEP